MHVKAIGSLQVQDIRVGFAGARCIAAELPLLNWYRQISIGQIDLSLRRHSPRPNFQRSAQREVRPRNNEAYGSRPRCLQSDGGLIAGRRRVTELSGLYTSKGHPQLVQINPQSAAGGVPDARRRWFGT